MLLGAAAPKHHFWAGLSSCGILDWLRSLSLASSVQHGWLSNQNFTDHFSAWRHAEQRKPPMSDQLDSTVYYLAANGLSLDCDPPLPFDVATYSTRSRVVDGRLESVKSRVSLLEKTHERHPDHLRETLEEHQRRTIKASLPTINVGLLPLVERELVERGERVSVQSRLRRPELFGPASDSAISRFVAQNNSGIIRYASGLTRLEVIQEISGAFPEAKIAVVALNTDVARSIASRITGGFLVRQQRLFTEEEADSRVFVGTCSALNQGYLSTHMRDLFILTDPSLCNHEMCERLMFHPDANPRIFVLQQDSVEVAPKISDRVLQYVGVETLVIGPGNRQKCEISVSYHKETTGADPRVRDAVGLVRILENSETRNREIAKLARKHVSADPNSMTVLLCASDLHAQQLAERLTDWTYVHSSHLAKGDMPETLATRAVADSRLAGTHRNLVCTTACLESMPQRLTNVTIIWAGLRSAPFDVPNRLYWMEPGSIRSIRVIDVQDQMYTRSNPRDSHTNPKGKPPKTEQNRNEFDAIRCLVSWNNSRRRDYESRGWWPSGQDASVMRLDAARKRLVVNRTESSSMTTQTKSMEVANAS